MCHTIEFVNDFLIDVEVPSQQRLVRAKVKRGARLNARIAPYVVEIEEGPIEVADLYLADGTVTRTVRFGCFRFVDQPSAVS